MIAWGQPFHNDYAKKGSTIRMKYSRDTCNTLSYSNHYNYGSTRSNLGVLMASLRDHTIVTAHYSMVAKVIKNNASKMQERKE